MHWVSGVGDKAVFETRSTGWWIVIDKIALYVGPDKPDFAEGELIKLSIEKARSSRVCACQAVLLGSFFRHREPARCAGYCLYFYSL